MATVIVNAKVPCGKCYFKDGHVEDIVYYTYYSEENIVFITESGEYQFRKWAEPLEHEMLYADNRPTMLMIPKHAFFKIMGFGLDPIVADIEKIEIE